MHGLVARETRWSLLLLGFLTAISGPAHAAEAFLPLRLGEVKPEGWLRAQLQRDLVSGYEGHLDALLQDPKSHKFLLQPENNDFVTRADSKDSRHDPQGRSMPPEPHSWWDGEMIGDWHDALIRAAFLTGEPKARQRADRYVAAILKSQDADGYIGIYPRNYRYHFSSSDAELWTQRCVLLGLLAYYEFTGQEKVLDAVQRAVKLTIRQYGPGQNYFDNPHQKDSGVAHGLMFLDVLEWLYRLTGDEEYRRAALSLYDDYNAATRIHERDTQLARLLDLRAPLGGHGPDTMGLMRVPLLCYYLSGKDVYRQAWENSIRKTQRHLGVGGSPLSGQGEEIKQDHQTPDMPYEYCSTFYLMHTLTWAMQKTGESRYGDMFERTLFNAAHGARFANGKALTYYSADERFWVRQRPPEGAPNARYLYTAAFYPCCCHNSGARVYPYTISALWMRNRGADGDGLVATLYGPSRVAAKIHDVAVRVVEKTGYPFSFTVDLSIEAAAEVAFPLRLRVPAWSGEPAVTAAGAVVTRDPRGFLVLNKKWKSGDTVRLALAPTIHGRTAVNGTTAVAYGPLVFSLPIAEKAEIIQRFPQAEAAGLKGFYGYQYDPLDLASAKRPLKLRGDRPDFGFRVVESKESDPLHPWDRAPLTLRGTMVGANHNPEDVVLLPMGCTLLRRTCFPAIAPAPKGRAEKAQGAALGR
jgi:DUF1680 family protein